MMDFSKLEKLTIHGVELKQLFIDGIQVWAMEGKNLWDLADRAGENVFWHAAVTPFNYDTTKYYYPATRAGVCNGNGITVSDIVLANDSVRLHSTAALYGINLAFLLDTEKKYRLQAKVGNASRIDRVFYNQDNVYQDFLNLGTSGQSVDYSFVPTERTFTVFHISPTSANSTASITDISLTEV